MLKHFAHNAALALNANATASSDPAPDPGIDLDSINPQVIVGPMVSSTDLQHWPSLSLGVVTDSQRASGLSLSLT